MIDHTGVGVSDYRKSKAFYLKALEPLGYRVILELPEKLVPQGGSPYYHRNYYGAFVLDPDGHNIEAVCHEPA